MDSIDNFRERIEALEQWTKQLQQHTRIAERRRRCWRLPWPVAAVVALGLAMALSLPLQAKTLALSTSARRLSVKVTRPPTVWSRMEVS
jgi:hypothetical protein